MLSTLEKKNLLFTLEKKNLLFTLAIGKFQLATNSNNIATRKA